MDQKTLVSSCVSLYTSMMITLLATGFDVGSTTYTTPRSRLASTQVAVLGRRNVCYEKRGPPSDVDLFDQDNTAFGSDNNSRKF